MNLFLPAKIIFASPVLPWKKPFFPPSSKNLPTLFSGNDGVHELMFYFPTN